MSHDIEVMSEDGHGMELEPVAPAPVTLFRSDDPNEVVARATETANVLANVVRQKKLTVKIGQSEHAKVEAWTLLGTLLGVFPVCVWTRKLEDGWEARVEARTLAGLVVGAAEAQCTRLERTWSGRDDYALRSMAQTRATSKALRQPLGFVMTLAGFSPTPADEMPGGGSANDGQLPRGRSSATDGNQPSPGVITPAQATRLYSIATASKVPKDEAKRIILEIAGVESSRDIPVAKYKEICAAIEAAALPF